ncbi:fimbrial protein [Pseudaminobacter soli (ex Li et al. 2025)]|uniref:Fimbrial protein n=1 Tax=Pseudaminobacter soli (ex Li et al. 2025) TaxID=1295366 RepID=A0A2P7SA40_9HYPH|nr:fimbrial protein [Mesorhizobium soli]PSJ59320.1 fimbrial protein [Mesorhizobium soli]
MASPHLNDEDEKPLDPSVEKVRRKLVRFIAINLGLLFIALMAVLAAIVYKTGKTEAPAITNGGVPSPSEQAFMSGDIALPTGAKVISQSLSGNRISIEAELADGSRAIFLYDFAERRMVGRFAVTQQ